MNSEILRAISMEELYPHPANPRKDVGGRNGPAHGQFARHTERRGGYENVCLAGGMVKPETLFSGCDDK